jgi:ketosteroid isomerase-like protein
MNDNDPQANTHAERWPVWLQALYDPADRLDSAGFASHFAPDATLRFANSPEVAGRTQIEASLKGFFGTITSMSHRFVRVWEHGQHAAMESVVTYGRADGQRVEVPAVTTYTRASTGEITNCRIYCDISLVYTEG